MTNIDTSVYQKRNDVASGNTCESSLQRVRILKTGKYFRSQRSILRKALCLPSKPAKLAVGFGLRELALFKTEVLKFTPKYRVLRSHTLCDYAGSRLAIIL